MTVLKQNSTDLKAYPQINRIWSIRFLESKLFHFQNTFWYHLTYEISDVDQVPIPKPQFLITQYLEFPESFKYL